MAFDLQAMYASRWKPKGFPPGYNYVYYLLRERGYTHDQALHGAYAGYYKKQEAEDAQKKAERKAMQQQLATFGGGILGAGGGAFLGKLGYDAAAKMTGTGVAGGGAGAGGGIAAGGGGAGAAAEAGTGISGIGPVASGGEYGAAIMGATPAYIPAAAALWTAGAGKAGYDMARGKKPGWEGDTTLGTNPATAWAYWPAKFAMGLFGKGPKTEVEDKRVQALIDSGTISADQAKALYPNGFTSEGRSDQLSAALANGAQPGSFGFDKSGNWYNTEFLAGGNESTLKPEDIWGYSAFLERYGSDWLNKFSEEDRRKIAGAAIDSGAVREHHGTVDVDFSLVDKFLSDHPDYQFGGGSNNPMLEEAPATPPPAQVNPIVGGLAGKTLGSQEPAQFTPISTQPGSNVTVPGFMPNMTNASPVWGAEQAQKPAGWTQQAWYNYLKQLGIKYDPQTGVPI